MNLKNLVKFQWKDFEIAAIGRPEGPGASTMFEASQARQAIAIQAAFSARAAFKLFYLPITSYPITTYRVIGNYCDDGM